MSLCTFTTDVYRVATSTALTSFRCVNLFAPCSQHLLCGPSVVHPVTKQDSVDWIPFCPHITIHLFCESHSSNIPIAALSLFHSHSCPFLHKIAIY